MKKNIFFALLILLGTVANAQKSTDAKQGDYSCLKGVKHVNVKFTYDGMTVGKNQTEEDYVAGKVAEKNEKKPGSGDEWLKSWEKGKLNDYEPAFAKAFTKKLEKKTGIKATVGDDAPLTIIVNTTRMEPGFNAGVVSMKSEIDVDISFVETANPDNIKSMVFMTKIYGSEAFAVSDRLSASYYGAGALLAKYISKSLK